MNAEDIILTKDQNGGKGILRYFEEIKDEVYTCALCNYEIKIYNKRLHERGVGHKYMAEQKERGEEPEKNKNG